MLFFYIQKGKVRLTVVSKSGKEATIGILNESDFFGEGCLTGQLLRLCSAIAMTDCSVMRIEKKSMMEVLHREQTFSDLFVAYLLTRNIRYEEDLVDQLFNSSEKRLARILLLLAHFGKDGKPEVAIPKISQETLAEMIGTTWFCFALAAFLPSVFLDWPTISQRNAMRAVNAARWPAILGRGWPKQTTLLRTGLSEEAGDTRPAQDKMRK